MNLRLVNCNPTPPPPQPVPWRCGCGCKSVSYTGTGLEQQGGAMVFTQGQYHLSDQMRCAGCDLLVAVFDRKREQWRTVR